MLNEYRGLRVLCSKDTAVNTGTGVTEEVKCRWGSVQPSLVTLSFLKYEPVMFPLFSFSYSHSISITIRPPLLCLRTPFFCSQNGPSVPAPEEMSLGRLLRRASSKASDLLTFNPGAGGTSLRSGLDGEIIFSKNNVCVHPAEPLPGLAEHHPGKTGPMEAVCYQLDFFVVWLSSNMHT